MSAFIGWRVAARAGWDNPERESLIFLCAGMSIASREHMLGEHFRKDVVTVGPQDTVLHAARLMRDRHVGALVVVRQKRPIGLVTDRDLAIDVLADERAPGTAIGEVMTPWPTTVPAKAGLGVAIALMREHGVRRLPVVDDSGELCGLVALDDILVMLGEELSSLAGALAHEQLRERRERSGGDEEEAA